MMAPHLRMTLAQRLWPLLVLCLFFKALTPTGWMPEIGRGGVELVLCSATGAGKAVVDLGLPDSDHDADKAGLHSPCTFAGLGVPLLPVAPAMAAPLAMLVRTLPPTGPPPAPVALRHRLPPATAPPALS